MLTGLAMCAFVGLFVFEFRERSFIWGAIGIAIIFSLKSWFALLLGYRILGKDGVPRFDPQSGPALA
jgi:hypothetical protein